MQCGRRIRSITIRPFHIVFEQRKSPCAQFISTSTEFRFHFSIRSPVLNLLFSVSLSFLHISHSRPTTESCARHTHTRGKQSAKKKIFIKLLLCKAIERDFLSSFWLGSGQWAIAMGKHFTIIITSPSLSNARYSDLFLFFLLAIWFSSEHPKRVN